MVSAVHSHVHRCDWSSNAVRAQLDANARELAGNTYAALEGQRDAKAAELLRSQQGLLDLLA
jgi:hypothetical protein